MNEGEILIVEDNLLHSDLTWKIIKAFFTVYNSLGYGFLEKVYENAMVIELRNMGLKVDQQQSIIVYYENIPVGYYKSDIEVEGCVIIENKCSEELCEEDEYQLINYLKATKMEVGLLLNFGKRPKFKRKIFKNENKHP
ncbi:MAG: GxxExxY protein [Chitinophagales bacterium]